MKIKSMNILALGVFIASLDITYLNGLSHALGNVLFLLRITIIVLLILASVATYSGVGTIKSIKLNKLKQELEDKNK